MAWWLFQINTEKSIDGKRYTLEDLKDEIEKGSVEWNKYVSNFYKQVKINDDILIRIVKQEQETFYSSKTVAYGKIVGIPKEYGDLFKIKFDKEISDRLLKNPIDFEKIKEFIRDDTKNMTMNRTIIPMSDETANLIA